MSGKINENGRIPVGYKDRRREGDTTLRQTQLVLLHLLHILDEICQRHNIQYWLAWGSCIGAMRHDGFIPWDDDLDIALLEKDYKRLLEVLPDELPSDAYLQLPKDYPRLAIPFAKVRDVNSFCGEIRPDVSIADPSGLFVDIFPFVDVPDIGRIGVNVLRTVCGSAWHRYKYFKNMASLSVLKALWCIPFAALCRTVSLSVMGVVWLLRKVLPCSHVGVCFEHGETYNYEKAWFSSTKLHKFEDGEFPVPIGAEEYMTVRYGNWREIPPPEKRPFHALYVDPFRSLDGKHVFPMHGVK